MHDSIWATLPHSIRPKGKHIGSHVCVQKELSITEMKTILSETLIMQPVPFAWKGFLETVMKQGVIK